MDGQMTSDYCSIYIVKALKDAYLMKFSKYILK